MKLQVIVRKENLGDLLHLVESTAEEAREAENSIKITNTLEKGIKKALEDNNIATYWVLVDESDNP